MEWFISILLKVLIEKFTDISIKVFKLVMLKRGINIKAEKNVEVIAQGDSQLSDGNIQGWLDELNNEEN